MGRGQFDAGVNGLNNSYFHSVKTSTFTYIHYKAGLEFQYTFCRWIEEVYKPGISVQCN